MAHAATARKKAEKKREAEGEKRREGEREREREKRQIESRSRARRHSAVWRSPALRAWGCVWLLVYLVSSSIAAGFSR